MRDRKGSQPQSFRRPPLPTSLRERPPHKGRGREPEPWGGGSQGWGPEEGGWLQSVGLRAEGDSALTRQVFRRLPGPDSSPRVRSVPAGAPSARLGPQVSLAQRRPRASGVLRTSPVALGERARCLQSEVTQSGRVGAQDTCASHGGHTEGSRVRDAPVWHKRGSTTHHRSVGLMAGVGTPTLSVPPRRGLEVTAESCLSIPVVFPRKQAARIQSRMLSGRPVSPGGQLDSRQNLRDHSWTSFVSALNLGPSFLKAVARSRSGGNSRGSELL